MTELIDQLRGSYDLVLVDAPPVLPFADAAAAAAACDGAILVVRYGKARAAQLRQAKDALAAVGSPVLASMLNMTPARQHPEYGYGYRRYRPANDAGRHNGDGDSTVGERAPTSSPAAMSLGDGTSVTVLSGLFSTRGQRDVRNTEPT
jgi:Mrp family chromosome partitioning ATPase